MHARSNYLQLYTVRVGRGVQIMRGMRAILLVGENSASVQRDVRQQQQPQRHGRAGAVRARRQGVDRIGVPRMWQLLLALRKRQLGVGHVRRVHGMTPVLDGVPVHAAHVNEFSSAHRIVHIDKRVAAARLQARPPTWFEGRALRVTGGAQGGRACGLDERHGMEHGRRLR